MSSTPITATFDIAIKESKPVVTRNFTFKDGDTISFTVTLPQNYEASLSDLHRQSVDAAITHLKAAIGQQ